MAVHSRGRGPGHLSRWSLASVGQLNRLNARTADGTLYSTPRTALAADGTSYTVPQAVLAADGTSYNVI